MQLLKDRIEYALKNAKLDQSELARRIGVTSVAVNGWCTGASKSIRGENLLKASAVLRVNPTWLATGKGPIREEDGEFLQVASLIADDRLPKDSGFTNLAVPDDLLPMFQAWLSLYVNRTLSPAVIESVTALANGLNPAVTQQGTAASPDRIAAANKALEEHRAEAVAAGTAGQVKPGVFKTKR